MSRESEALAYGESVWRGTSQHNACFGCDAKHYTDCPNTNCEMQRGDRLNEHVIEVVAAGDRVVQQCTCGWSGEMRCYVNLPTLTAEAEAHRRSVP